MFQRILLPIDGTADSEKAVPYALGLAQSLGAEVVVCCVIPTPLTPNSPNEERDTAKYVGRIAQRFRSAGLDVKTHVRRGEPAREIEKAALESNADAIVMATRSRQRLQKLMLGSVADLVVRDSQLPVLLVSSAWQADRALHRAS